MPNNTKKKILFAASECVPFMKTGGLADVIGALPKAIDPERFDVRVIMPKYLCIADEWTEKMEYLTNFTVDLAWRKKYAGVFVLEYQGIKVYFIDDEYYFSGDAPYGPIHYDIEKFAFYSKAVIETCQYIDFIPDLIHCHDWQAALIPVFIDEARKRMGPEGRIKTILTIHNLRFQGQWSLDGIKDITGLPDEYYRGGVLEAYGDGNYLKGGIVTADRVTTVSDTYSHEILESFYGEGLDAVLRDCADKLSGIVNGLDYEDFDPSSEPRINNHYNSDTFRKIRPKNKLALQRECWLANDNKAFVLGIVSRLTDQKGFDMFGSIVEDLIADGIQIAVIGSGEQRFEQMFQGFCDRYPGRFSYYNGYDERRARMIYAGADAFVMPSVFEPCGLSQLISLRYGSVPIVRETGGLKDTVEPYNEYENRGTGFSFANLSAYELLHTIRYAHRIFREHKARWNQMIERGMKQDFSWKQSAADYERIYDELI